VRTLRNSIRQHLSCFFLLQVLTAGGVYTAYFFGGTYDSNPAALYAGADLTDSDEKEDGSEVTGATLRIGIALSQNGINWYINVFFCAIFGDVESIEGFSR